VIHPPPDATAPERLRLRDVLSPDEIRALCTLSTFRSSASLLVNWALVLGAMRLVYVWPNPLSVILALFVIGGRQLGLAIFMHDASHHAVFPNRRLNDWAGNWLCAYPVWADMDAYRPYHMQHHNHNWTADDPDLNLALPFPVTRASFKRKVWRDLSGQTGLKLLVFSLRRDLGTEGSLITRLGRTLRHHASFRGMVITNLLLVAVSALVGHVALYLLWVAAYLTTYALVTRIRSIAEHSMAKDPSDPLKNTRTTLASFWERLFIAPNRVNYHLEHHLLMTVPHYNLPKMHALLKERGLLDDALVSPGYLSVLRAAASKPDI
jgi:fatty acid desaturase